MIVTSSGCNPAQFRFIHQGENYKTVLAINILEARQLQQEAKTWLLYKKKAPLYGEFEVQGSRFILLMHHA